MTTVAEIEQVCAVCGTESEHLVVASTNASDLELDGRPLGTARESAYGRALRCPTCGHCSPCLEFSFEGLPGLVHSDGYQAILSDRRYPKSAREALCAAIVTVCAGYPSDAFRFHMMATWDCDEAGKAKEALECRRLALRDLDELHAQDCLVGDEMVDDVLLRVDILRRSGEFGPAKELCSTLLSEGHLESEDQRLQVAEFELHLLRSGDASAHAFGEVGSGYARSAIFML